MAPYLLAFIAPIALSPLRARNRVAYVFLLSAVWAVFAGIRGEIGGDDYFNYRNLYASLLPGQEPVWTYEPLFMAMARVSKAIGLPYHGFLAIVALLGILPSVYVIDKTTNGSSLGIFVYGIDFMLTLSFVYLRQGIAIGFAFLALDAMLDRKMGRSALCVVLAAGFHYSALALFAILFLRKEIGTGVRTALYAIAALLGMFIIVSFAYGTVDISENELVRRLTKFLAGGGEMKINPLNFIEVLLLAITMRSFARACVAEAGADYLALLRNCFLIFLIFILYGTIEAIFIRFAGYFRIAVPILLSISARNAEWFHLPRIRMIRKMPAPSWGSLVSVMVFVYYLAKMTRWLILNAGGNGGFLPYRTMQWLP